jgi:hypothetical protein
MMQRSANNAFHFNGKAEAEKTSKETARTTHEALRLRRQAARSPAVHADGV